MLIAITGIPISIISPEMVRESPTSKSCLSKFTTNESAKISTNCNGTSTDSTKATPKTYPNTRGIM